MVQAMSISSPADMPIGKKNETGGISPHLQRALPRQRRHRQHQPLRQRDDLVVILAVGATLDRVGIGPTYGILVVAIAAMAASALPGLNCN